MARSSRAGAGPGHGHGRLGAALRVVGAVLHAGEAALPRARRAPSSARPAPAAPATPRHRGRVDALAPGVLGLRTHVCDPGPPVPLAFTPGELPSRVRT